MGYFPPHSAKTTLSCEKCGQPLTVRRSCHEVKLECPACGAEYPLRAYIDKADPALEEFLETVYLDRI